MKKIIINKNYVENLYIMLTASILIHYVLVILITLLILKEIFFSGEYKKILSGWRKFLEMPVNMKSKIEIYI